MQGVVIGVGEESEFGSVFKMMQSEEVRVRWREGGRELMCVCVCVCVCVCAGPQDTTAEEQGHSWQAAVFLFPSHHWSVLGNAFPWGQQQLLSWWGEGPLKPW